MQARQIVRGLDSAYCLIDYLVLPTPNVKDRNVNNVIRYAQ